MILLGIGVGIALTVGFFWVMGSERLDEYEARILAARAMERKKHLG